MSYAFFDFDKTIIHGDAGPMFGKWWLKRRAEGVDERHGKRVATAMKTAMNARLVPYFAWMGFQSALYKARAVRRSTVIRNAYKGLKGVPVDDLDAMMEVFVDTYIAPRIYPDVRVEMEAHIAAGRQCVIITTGMERLVRKCLRYLPPGVDLVGCELEEKRGRLTGRIISGPLYGADKANIILAMCRAAGVQPADCHAYTDHYSDKHMLEAVGHGVCINPAPRLSALAKQNGWRILRPEDPRV